MHPIHHCFPPRSRFPLALLTLVGLSSTALAGFTNPQVPAFRGAPDTHFAGWESFTIPEGAFNAPDDVNTTAPAAGLLQTSPGAILVGGNIYHPSMAPMFILQDTVPQDAQEVVIQISTRGAELVYTATTLVYTNDLGVEVPMPYDTYTELANYTQVGQYVESMYTWDLSGLADTILDYEIHFEAALPNLSLDAVILDTRYSPGPVQAFCFGDGTGAGCPCGNTGAAGRGCSGGSSANGALLSWSGSANVASADLVLHGSDLPGNVFGLFFQGANQVNGGNGNFFGDGLLCTNAPIIRLEVAPTDSTGQVSTTVDIPATGGAVAGTPLHYQLWYRDTQGSFCGSGFNTTNAITVSWQ